MSDYLNIIANWGSNAKAGRERARQEQNNQLKILENQYKIQQTNNAIEANVEAELSYNYAQANELAKFYRPEDKKRMQEVEQEALNEIKSQLEFFGDDVMAFMRGGGRDLLNNYRDKVLGSNEAKTIRANHKSLVQYLDQMKTDASLISHADHMGFQNWKNGNVNAFVFQGAYTPYTPASEDDMQKASGTGINARAIALLENDENLQAAVNNMNIDNYGGRADYNLFDEGIREKAIGYLNTIHFRGKDMTIGERDAFRGYTDSSTKMSDHLKMIGDAWDHHFTGDFMDEEGNSIFAKDAFDAKNWNARQNLIALTNAQPFTTRDHDNNFNKNSWGMQIFPGLEDRIASGIFKRQYGENDAKKTMSSKELAGLISSGAHMVYNEDGVQMMNTSNLDMRENETLGILGKDWDIHSIEYGFEVEEVDGNITTKRLLTRDLVEQKGDSTDLLKNKTKTGVMYFVLRDAEYFPSFTKDEKSGYGKRDQFMYVKIDMEQWFNQKVIDEVSGEVDYKNKTVAQTSPNVWVWQGEGEKFSWIADNQVRAVKSLMFGTQKGPAPIETLRYMKGVPEGNTVFNAVVLAHALNESDILHPEDFIYQYANSQDPVHVKALEALKDDVSSGEKANIIDYINILTNSQDANGNPYMTTKEAKDLLNSYERIVQTFWTVGQTIEPVPGTQDQYQIDPFYKQF
jgi:hypothetical protein